MKRLFEMAAWLLVITTLAGCATAYQKRGLGGGYSETRMDDTHYAVYFDGNGYASKDRVWYFWIYRCAQLTLEKGYTYFSLAPVQSSMAKPTSFDAYESGHAYPAVLIGDAHGHLINVHSGGGHAGGFVYVPGGGGTIISWHSKAIVTMYGDNVPPKMFVVRAQSILDMLAEYIKTDGSSTPPDRTAISNEATYAVAPDNTVVNVHQYLLTHVRKIDAPAPYDYSAPSYAIQPARSGTAVTQPPPTPPPPTAIVSAGSTPADPASTAPVTALAAKTAALNARPSMAQSVATQLGCGAVQANGDSTYVAPCETYSVLISCDDNQCRPMHTVNAKSEE